jgi:membrane fusion protein, multidrug efflux system
VKKQQLVAAAILIAVVVWMIVPRETETPSAEQYSSGRTIEAISEGQSASENPEVITVRATRISQQNYNEQIRVRGRTQAFRNVEVRAEQAGQIVSEPIPRGAKVAKGDVLCEIAVDNRSADLQENQARLEQAEFEYNAAVDLRKRSLQSEVAVAQLKAAMESAKAAVARTELALKNTKVRAPFDGIVETRTVELGDYLNVGTVCASILDVNPMLLVGFIPEQDVASLSVGSTVNAEIISGEQVKATVTYLSRNADDVSRSYRLEAEVENTGQVLRSGITADLLVSAANLQAHLIPASALTLDDNGVVGVKLIDDSGLVSFRNVTIVGDDINGLTSRIWVTGLSGDVNLVTLGQEIVFPGQTVNSNFEWSK